MGRRPFHRGSTGERPLGDGGGEALLPACLRVEALPGGRRRLLWWKRINGRKQPYFVGRKDDRPFGLAGLWERWEKQGGPVESCTILTTDANELMQPIHERMPVILPPDQYDLWLDPRCQDSEKLAKLLRPFPSEGMLAYRVSALVNNPKNDVPQCVEAMP